MGQNSIISQRAKKASAEGQRPLQELEVGPRSGPYLLVISKVKINSIHEDRGTEIERHKTKQDRLADIKKSSTVPQSSKLPAR